MSNVPTNLIPSTITQLPEYGGSSTLGYFPYSVNGRTYKVQFSNLAAVGAVPSSRVIAAGTGLAGGGDLSENRVISIANGGVGFDQLSATGVSAGSYGSGGDVPVITVDAKGRVTDISTTPLVVTGYVPTSRTITTGAGLLGGGSLASNRTLSVDFYASAPQALGSASPGVSNAAARGDHVHPAVNLSDTTQTQGALPLGRGGTGDALSPVAGAVVYSTGTKLALADPGDPGQVLTSAGTGEPYWSTIAGTGTVTSVSVLTANGFSGTVAFANTTPQITIRTTVTGMVKGDGVSLSEATPGVDYVAPSAYTSSGLTMATSRMLGRTDLGTGAAQEITVGTGLTLASGSLVNSAPDQTVTLTGGTAISIGGSYPSFTITNTAPDQIVSLTGAGTTAVTGTYPNFTITSNDQYTGTVTSVAASGGTTGLTFSGSPITTSGTLTLGGTLAAANGGTGQTTYTDGQLLIGNSVGNTLTKSTLTAGSGVSISNGNGSITISATGTGGTVTSVNASGGSTGLTFSGGPVTSSGTLTLSGTLAVASGGTGAATAGAARTALGAAASGANTDITSIALTSGTILNSPVNATDIANKGYVDSISAGINFHQAVRLASTTALPAYTYNNGSSGVGATITANANGALTLDGVAAASGNRVLIKNETSGNAPYNGVYVVTQTGNGSTPFILTRASDYNTAGTGVNQIDAGDFFLVTAGSTQANTSWVQQTPLPIVVGTTGIVFSQFGAPITYSAGTGLTLAGTVFSITNTGVTASTYGSASQVPVIAVNAQGQITSASSSSIAIAASQVTSGVLAVANGGTGQSSYTDGQLLIGNSVGNTLSKATLTAGSGVSISNGNGSITISATGTGGTVTSVNASGGTTGLTFSGGPITSSGTLTLSGTVAVGSGGTGATSLTSGYLLKGNGTSAVSASVVYDNGTNVGIGTASPAQKLDVAGLIQATSNYPDIRLLTSSGYGWRMAAGSNGTTLDKLYFQSTTNSFAGASTTMVFDGGNVGIGTAFPGSKLDVAGTGYFSDNVTISRTNTAGSLSGMTITNAGTTAAYAGININSGTVTSQLFNDAAGNAVVAGAVLRTTSNHPLVFGTNATERMRIDASGNVLIGTTTAVDNNFPLELNAGASGLRGMGVNNNGGYGVYLTYDNTGRYSTNGAAIRNIANSPLYFETNNTLRATLDTSGNFIVNNGQVNSKNTALFFGDGADNSASVYATGGPVKFYANGSEGMRLTAAGNVGIGTSSPGYKLDVSGVINTNAALRMVPTNVGAFTRAQLQSAYNLDNTAASVFTWNYTNGGGELDLFINRDGGGVGGLKIYDFPNTSGNPTNILTVEGGGNVGIGTTSPGATLTVAINTTSHTGMRVINSSTTQYAGSGLQMLGPSAAGTQGGVGVYYYNTNVGGTQGALGIAQLDNNGSFQRNLAYYDFNGQYWGFLTNSTERMRIDSSGNVGIGTSAPQGLLHVVAGTNNTLLFRGPINLGTGGSIYAVNSANSTVTPMEFGASAYYFAGGYVGIGTSSPTNMLSVAGTINSNNLLMQGDGSNGYVRPTNAGSSLYLGAANSNYIQLASDGSTYFNVGGVSNTHQFLYNESGGEIQLVDSTGAGPILLDNSGGLARLLKVGSGSMAVGTTSTGFLRFQTADTERMRIDGSGNVGIGTSTTTYKLNVAGDLYLAGGGDLRLSSASGGNDTSLYNDAQDLFFVVNGSTRMYVNSSGNVGIGTSSPSQKLTLQGAQLIIPAAGWSSGQTAYLYLGDTNNGINSTNGGYTTYFNFNGHNWLINGTEAMRIDGGRNVGIGTTSVGSRLNVKGGMTWIQNFNGSASSPTEAIDWPVPALNVASFGDFTLQTMMAFTLPNDGNYFTGDTVWNIRLEQTASSITSSSSTGFRLMGPGYLAFGSGQQERLRFTSTGGITSSDLADAVGYKGLPQNAQTGAYTLALSDMGKHISITTGGVVIPANASVAFPIGSAITIFNNSGSNQTISITSDTLRQAGTANTGSRTLAQYGVATVMKVTSTVWVITGAGVS